MLLVSVARNLTLGCSTGLFFPIHDLIRLTYTVNHRFRGMIMLHLYGATLLTIIEDLW